MVEEVTNDAVTNEEEANEQAPDLGKMGEEVSKEGGIVSFKAEETNEQAPDVGITVEEVTNEAVTNEEVTNSGKYVNFGVFLFVCLGLALLYPYNAVISAADWWIYILPDSENVVGKMANANFIASLITTFFILAFASPKTEKSSEERRGAFQRRTSSRFLTMTRGLKSRFLMMETRILIGFVFEAAPLFVFSLIRPTEAVALGLSFVVGIGDSLAQSGIFPLASGIHVRCIAAASMGSALAGLIAGLLRLFTKAIFPDEDDKSMRWSSTIYFWIASLVLFGCMVSLYVVIQLKDKITVAFLEKSGEEGHNKVQEQDHDVETTKKDEEEEVQEQDDVEASKKDEEEADNTVQEQDGVDASSGAEEGPASNTSKEGCRSTFEVLKVYIDALKVCWRPVLVCFLNFFITLSLFPGVVLAMESEALDTWMPVILITLFNLFDTISRIILTFDRVADWLISPMGAEVKHAETGVVLGYRLPKMLYTLELPCLARLVFYPLVIFCVNPLYIESDVVRFIIISLFAFSSGWVYTVCYMVGPAMCKEKQHKEAASLLMIVSTLVSLGVASSVGLVIVNKVVP